MEPSPETFEEVGRLCAAWSYLELVTEQSIWGVLEVADKLGPVITSRLDMRGRWQLLLEWAPRKHEHRDLDELRSINVDMAAVGTDRNIIVHGIIHASMALHEKPPPYTILGAAGATMPFHRPPCWTVARGPNAGKNFPISKKAVETVRLNIQKVGKRGRCI